MGTVIQTTNMYKIKCEEVTTCLTCPFHSTAYDFKNVKIGEACSVLVGELIDDGVDIEEGVDPGCPLVDGVFIISDKKVLTKHDQSILTAYLSDRENNSLHIIRRPDIDEKGIERESDNLWVITLIIGICILILHRLYAHGIIRL